MKSIADVVSASGLAGYAEIALVIFFAVFLVVGVRALWGNRSALDHAARLPLDDDLARRSEHPL
jgi:cbb3-type cytochrome oxidase subunit 3